MIDGLVHKIAVLCKDYHVIRTIDELFICSDAIPSWWTEATTGSAYYSERMNNVYGWVEGIKQHAPDQLNRILESVATQLADDERISESDRNYLRERIAQLEKFTHQPLLEATTQIAIANSFELDQHLDRIRKAIDVDPELAVGSTKELVESVLKTVLVGFGEDIGNDDFPKLLKRAQKLLKLDPSEVNPNAKGVDVIKRTLSNLGQIVSGISELRNYYGTGHGKVQKSGISPRHARLVVGAGATLATFLMETFELHQSSDSLDGSPQSD
ncbi:MAG: abortive infection family protein [Anaerolineae bacterium]|nr:abortive infection family protein [Anaerolineae bacterium]